MIKDLLSRINIDVFLFYLLLFLMISFPSSYMEIKGVLLSIIIACIFLKIFISKKVCIHIYVFLWSIFIISVGLFFVKIGVINGTPGALRVSTTYIIWPAVFSLIVSEINKREHIDNIFRVMIFSLIFISIYSIYYLLYASSFIPESLYFELDMGQAVGFYDGYIEYRVYAISSLIYLVPFALSMLFMSYREGGIPISRFWIILSCLLGVLVAVLSGRRALWLILIISPIIIFLWFFLKKTTHARVNLRSVFNFFVVFVTFIAFILISGSYIGLNYYSILEVFLSGFNFSTGGPGESARAEQFYTLIKSWMDSPIIGAGHGASAPGPLRSEEMPWAYELSYVALLFQTGILGFLSYLLAITWIFWMGAKIIRFNHWCGSYLLPTLVGMTCFLIANATNPYLAKFDYMWVIFLSVFLINIWLMGGRKKVVL